MSTDKTNPSDPSVTATAFVTITIPVGVAADPDTELAQALLAKDVDSEELLEALSKNVLDWIARFGEEGLTSEIDRILFDRSPKENCVVFEVLYLSCYHLPFEDWSEIEEGSFDYPGTCWEQHCDGQSVIVDIRGLDESDFGFDDENDAETEESFDEDDEHSRESHQFSRALLKCIEFAQSRCADFIRFDEAGTLVEELEKFEHP